ncbi:heme exporter protein CcmB [Chitinophaga sedimenti]|uniref:heme exporter protein CcmB n=1 Tax=Chitinophaga sedimenti TaxID=2033606 RepID=UPI00200307A5|nr:heme exporter protein CcmB [Chitinophaga sedimenti]MCK7559760.1 heme exporter protein CcmB [Chitinophaga sedimenti]
MKTYLSQIITLVKKDLVLEWRQKHAFFGIVLYIFATVFVINLMIMKPEDKIWNALFWIVQLFVCVNAVAKSFMQESRGRMLYFASLVHPRQFIIAKLIYNVILMLFMSIMSLVCCTMLLGNPIISPYYFIGVVMLGGLSLSLIFTMLAAIASQASQNAALMAIMGFPLIMPFLMLLGNISRTAFEPVLQPGLVYMFCLLGGLDVLVIGLALILFPYLWKE